MKGTKNYYTYLSEETKRKKIEEKTVKKLSTLYTKFLVEKVLNGYEVTLPARLGTISIRGKRQEIKIGEDGKVLGLAPDWVETKKLRDRCEIAKRERKVIYHLNQDTDNVRYKYFWSRLRVPIENKSLYALRITRENKRKASNKIRSKQKYVIKL